MKNIFTLKKLVVFAIALMTVVAINAQDAEKPWHVVVYEDGEEVASHSIEIINDMEVTAQDVNFVLEIGKNFSYPIGTTTFGFEPRTGNGTAIELIGAPKWNVYYANGNLRFTEAVNGVAIYTTHGVLAARFTGAYTEVPVNLNQGIYVIQAGGKNAKLLVSKSGFGGACVQPVETQAVPASSPVILRAASSGFKQYWNIAAGSSIVPIEIATVKEFYFTAGNSLMLGLKNGNTIELAGYKGVEFALTPAQTTGSDWDERTFVYGGATYAWRGPTSPVTITWAAVHKNGLAFHTVLIDYSYSEDKRFQNSAVNGKVWEAGKTNPDSRLSMFGGSKWDYGMSYTDVSETTQTVWVNLMTTEGVYQSTRASEWPYNNNSNLIQTTITKNTNGSIKMSCIDYIGEKHEYTFDAW